MIVEIGACVVGAGRRIGARRPGEIVDMAQKMAVLVLRYRAADTQPDAPVGGGGFGDIVAVDRDAAQKTDAEPVNDLVFQPGQPHIQRRQRKIRQRDVLDIQPAVANAGDGGIDFRNFGIGKVDPPVRVPLQLFARPVGRVDDRLHGFGGQPGGACGVDRNGCLVRHGLRFLYAAVCRHWKNANRYLRSASMYRCAWHRRVAACLGCRRGGAGRVCRGA